MAFQQREAVFPMPVPSWAARCCLHGLGTLAAAEDEHNCSSACWGLDDNEDRAGIGGADVAVAAAVGFGGMVDTAADGTD